MSSSLRTGWRKRIFVSIQGVPRKDRGRTTCRLELERYEDRVLMATLPLGAAESFAVLGGSTVTNTGSSVIVGDVGVSPGTAVTGFPPGLVTGGMIHMGDAVALQAQTDLTTAYNVLAGEPFQADLTGQDLGGKTLTPNVYHFSTSAQLTGMLTLDALGDPNARFDFQIGSTLTTASAASVRLINGADACNVFWQVGSSATLGTDTSFQGNILALASITLDTRANILNGRALALNGAVTLDTNNISNLCDMVVTPPANPPPVNPPPVNPPPVNPPPVNPPPVNPTPVNPPPVNPPPVNPPPVNPPPVNPPPVNPPPVNPPPVNPRVNPRVNPPVTSPINPPVTPPTVNAPPPVIILRRFGFHAQPTILVLSFGTPLDPSRAQDVSNYRIVTLGGPGRGGLRVGRSIGVLTAVYDPLALSVTLRPAERLDVHNFYQLTVKGTAPAGLAGPTGVPLGRDFVELISRSTLDGPAPTSLHGALSRRVEHPPVVALVSARGVDALSATKRWINVMRLARRQAAGH